MKSGVKNALQLIIPALLLLGGVSTLRAENLNVTIEAGQYQLTEAREGEQLIKMEDFGNLLIPGRPMLPAKTFMIALPPGAEVFSIQIEGLSPVEIEGQYSIKPAPPVLPSDGREEMVKECRHRWQDNFDLTYSSDLAYPDNVGEYLGTGGLRKYSFARVSYFPFSYRPQSGRLTFTPSIQVYIDYRLPSSTDEGLEELLWDTKGELRASRLLVNYAQAKEWYVPRTSRSASQQTYDYVIITADALVTAVSPLVVWKQSIGYSVNVVTITWIEANYSGADRQERIRNFLIDKYAEWGIEYLLLVGDIDVLPMRHCFPNPSNHDPSSSYCPPTDHYYAALTGGWDSDGDGYPAEFGEDTVDFVPEISVGRIPFNDSATVADICGKLVSFDGDNSPWKDNALLIGAMSNYANENFSGFPRTDGASLMEEMIPDMLSGWTYTTMYEKGGLDPCPYSCDYPVTWANVVDNWLANDYGIVNWWAHGGTDAVWRKWWEYDDGNGVPEGYEMYWEPFFENYYTPSLDDDHPSIVFSCACNNAWPEYDNLAKRLLEHGSAGMVASTRISWYNEGWTDEGSGGNASLDYYFFHYIIVEGEKVGDALYSSKTYYLNHLFWSFADPEWTPQQNLLDFNLYGDPALERKRTPEFVRGDANGDGEINVADIVYLVNFLYRGGDPPDPMDAGDANCDTIVDVADVVYLVNYLYRGGDPPAH